MLYVWFGWVGGGGGGGCLIFKINKDSFNKNLNKIPVLLSPEVVRSELVFVYEKPTPAGDSRKRIFASASIK